MSKGCQDPYPFLLLLILFLTQELLKGQQTTLKKGAIEISFLHGSSKKKCFGVNKPFAKKNNSEVTSHKSKKKKKNLLLQLKLS